MDSTEKKREGTRRFPTREEIMASTEAAQLACSENPNDPQSLKKLSEALVDLASIEDSEEEKFTLLQDAQLKLSQALDIDSKDDDIRLLLGMVSYKILIEYPSMLESDTKINTCAKAIECFEIVKCKEPDEVLWSTILETLNICAAGYIDHEPMEAAQELKSAKSASPVFIKYECEELASLNIKAAQNPNNAKNWRMLGTALLEISRHQDSENNKRGVIAEAIPKLENAFLLDPDDKEAKQLWLESRDQLIQLCQDAALYSVEKSPAAKGEASSIKKNEYKEGERMDIEYDFFEFCEAEAGRHPQNINNWTRWGNALMRVSCHESGIKKRMTIAEAIEKLEEALNLYPMQEKVKAKLIEAYDQLLEERIVYEDPERVACDVPGVFIKGKNKRGYRGGKLRRHELIAAKPAKLEHKRYGKACNELATNPQYWREWGTALLEKSGHENGPVGCYRTRFMVAAAIPMLENAFLFNQSNNRVKLKLLAAYNQLVQLCKDAGLYSDEKSPPAVKMEALCINVNEYTADDEFFDYCKVESCLHPHNVDNWKTWSNALMMLSSLESGIKKRMLLAEAIAKLEKAFFVHPKDKKVKGRLMEAYDQLLFMKTHK